MLRAGVSSKKVYFCQNLFLNIELFCLMIVNEILDIPLKFSPNEINPGRTINVWLKKVQKWNASLSRDRRKYFLQTGWLKYYYYYNLLTRNGRLVCNEPLC